MKPETLTDIQIILMGAAIITIIITTIIAITIGLEEIFHK